MNEECVNEVHEGGLPEAPVEGRLTNRPRSETTGSFDEMLEEGNMRRTPRFGRDRHSRLIAEALVALAMVATVVSVPVPMAAADTNHTFGYVIEFQNGQIVAGVTNEGSGNTAFVPDVGGTDPLNPADGMLIHMSCSDTFNLDKPSSDPDYGYGIAGQPSNPDDSGWRIADYYFYRAGTNGGRCGNPNLLAPAMSLTKETGTPSVTEPGEDVEFTITVTNDSLVDVITIDDLTDTEFDDVANTCLPTFIGSQLDPGESASCSFTEFIDAPHANTATVTATSDDDDPLEADASARVGYRDTPASIVVTKAASGGNVNIQAPGEQVTFDVTVANASSVDAVTITSLTDVVEQGAPFDITQVSGPVLATDCSLPQDIDAGDDYDCSFTVFVGGDTGDQVTNTVTASGTSEDDQPVIDDDSETVFLDNAWRIVLNKRQCATYDAIRTNENGANRLEAALPLGPAIDAAATPVNDAWENANHDCEEVANWPFTVGYASAIPGSSGYTGLAEELSHVLDPEATVFTDANGTAVLELSDEQLLELILNQGRIWIMEGRYEGTDLTFPVEEMSFGIIRCGTDALNGDNVEFLEAPDFANGDYTVTCYAYNVLEQPDLEIDKAVAAIDGDSYVDGDEATVGEEIDYTITVTNAGNVTLTGVTVSDDFVDGPLVCTWPDAEGTLAIGGSVVCTGIRVATAADAEAGTFTNVSVADANEVGEPKDDDATVPVVEPDAPAIAVTKAVDEDVIDRTGTVEFTIVVANIGNTDLTDLVVDDTMTDALGGTTDLPQCETPVTTDLAPGQSTEITCEVDLDVSVNGVGVVNAVTATATPPEGPDVADEATVEVTIIAPTGEGITLDKTVGPLGTPTGSSVFDDVYQRAFGEDAVTWQISLSNVSEYAIDDIDFSDAVSPSCEAAFDQAMDAAHPGDNLVIAGETIVFTCDLSDITEGTVVTNEATAVGAWPWDAPTQLVSDTALTLPGVQATDGSIGDTVWSDTNGNGKQDSGEKGIAGATVRLTIGGVTIDATTDANGAYLFTDLPAGIYTATLVVSSLPQPSDGELKVTTPGSFTIQLADSQAFLDADFGVVAALPTTGISSDIVTMVGLMLLGAGLLALMATRRRRQGDDASTG